MGTKPFAEQEVVAEILEQLLLADDVHARPTLRCADTYACQRALDEGRIDVLMEYTGTALHLLGEAVPAASADEAVTRLGERYAASGIDWVSPLGFSNGYVWVLRASPSGTEQTLSDLARRTEPLRVAVDAEYSQRPRDGLTATAARYGIKLAHAPQIIEDPLERYKAVATGIADVAVGYTTDVDPTDLGLTALRDDLGFFGRYDAAFMVRSDALESIPGLKEALDRLDHAIDDDAMREMNQAVALEGASTELVATRFLHDAGLVSGEETPRRRAPISVAVGSPTINRSTGTVTLAALRELFPTRSVALEPRNKPLDDVANGTSRFAIVTADRFFDEDRKNEDRKRRSVRRTDVEAIAVVGHAVVHRLRVGDGGELGVSKDGLGATLAVAEALGATPSSAFDNDEALINALIGGEVAEALVLAPTGDDAVVRALRHGARLVPASPETTGGWQLRHPYLRPGRIPPGLYAADQEAVGTFSTQIVVAGPATDPHRARVVGGPAAAVELHQATLSAEDRKRLATALGTSEATDPSLPSARTVPAEAEVDPWLDAVLNGLVLAFLGWVAFIVLAPARSAAKATSPDA